LLKGTTHRKAYIFFISCLAASISLGKAPMSISLIGLTLNWLLELDFQLKWKKIKDQKYLPIIFSGLFLIELFWLPISKDTTIGLNVLRIKLPLLLLPLIIGSCTSFFKREWKTIITNFFVGILVSTIWVYLVSLEILPTKKDSGTIRDVSIFMSHIRYSVLLSFSAVLILCLAFKNLVNKLIAVIIFLWLLFLIFKLATITAILGLSFALLFLFIAFLFSSKNKKKIVYIAGIASLFFLTGLYGTTIVNDFYHIKSKERTFQTHSIGGEKYQHDPQDNTTENGFYLWQNIAQKELERSWNRNSKISFKSKDKKKQPIKSTLYRFLTSKGLNKDSVGLNKLTQKEIQKIENGETSSVSYNNFEKRIRSLLFQRESRKKNSDPNNQTINQRVVFWKAGLDIFLNQTLFGYGPGGAKTQYKKYYKKQNTRLTKSNQLLAHNQFITQAINLGALGTILWLFVLVYSFLKVEKEIFIFLVPYLILMFFAFMSDDMLEVQAGVTIFSFFGTFLLFYNSKSLEAS
jgi:O-antigen ligase